MSNELSLEEIKACKDFDVLLDTLKNRSFYGHRSNAATALGNLGDDQAIGPLIEAFDDKDNDVSKAAAEALGVIGAASVDKLGEVSDNKESSVSARTSAVEALGKIEDERCADYIIRAIKDSEAQVRWTAAFCLGGMGCRQAVDPLILALDDENENVLINVVFALGRIGDSKAVDPLLKILLDDSRMDVRCSVANALGDIGDKRALEPLSRMTDVGNPIVRERVNVAIINLKKKSKKKWRLF